MRLRRAQNWSAGVRWWAVLALLTGILAVVIAFIGPGLEQVVAVAGLSITLALLASREEPS
jgi:hypothetical protein